VPALFRKLGISKPSPFARDVESRRQIRRVADQTTPSLSPLSARIWHPRRVTLPVWDRERVAARGVKGHVKSREVVSLSTWQSRPLLTFPACGNAASSASSGSGISGDCGSADHREEAEAARDSERRERAPSRCQGFSARFLARRASL